MKYTSYQKKTLYGLIKAIKRGRSFLIAAIFLALGFFSFISVCHASSIFNDDFDTYSNGDLGTQGVGWTCSYNYWNITGADYQTSPKSVIDDASSYVSLCQKTGVPRTEGSFTFQVKTTNCGSGGSRDEVLDFRFSGTPYNYLPYIEIKKDSGQCTITNEAITDARYVAMNTFDDWTKVSVSWYLNASDTAYYFKWSYGNATETAWTKGNSTLTQGNFPTGFDRIYLYASYGSGGEHFYIDSIGEVISPCSTHNDWNSCSLAGCYWNCFSLYVGVNPPQQCECENQPSGTCGSSYQDCQYCNSTSTCAAQTNCFWYEPAGVCRFGTTACAGTTLGLCNNQADCEAAGGYWYDNYCWYSPKPTYLTSWDDWYLAHGNHATATPFINDIASGTQGFFDAFGGFFGSFNQFFNLDEAYTRGNSLGGFIPIARGYLSFFDTYLAGFPIGEIFMFILIFEVAIVIIRLAARLFQLIKFW